MVLKSADVAEARSFETSKEAAGISFGGLDSGV